MKLTYPYFLLAMLSGAVVSIAMTTYDENRDDHERMRAAIFSLEQKVKALEQKQSPK